MSCPALRRCAVVLVAGLLAGASACGGDDGPSAADPLVDARTPEQLIADFRLADGALLRYDDFRPGYGWKVEIPPRDTAADGRLMDCAGVDDPAMALNDAAEDVELLASGDARVISAVNVYPNPTYAEAALAPVDLPDFGRCYEELLAEEAEATAPLGTEASAAVTVQRVDRGDEGVELRAELVVTAGGVEQRTYVELTSVRVGRAVTSLTTSNTGAPFDPGVRRELLDASIERLSEI